MLIRKVLLISARRVTQTDFVTAEFDLAAAQQLQRQLELDLVNDKTTLNQLLYRKPDEPSPIKGKLQFSGMEVRLDQLITPAKSSRREILAAAFARA